MSSRTARLTAIAIVAAAALPLSGCLYASIPAESQVTREPVDTPTPTAEVDDEVVDTGAGLSFADGAALSSDTYVEWSDGFFMDDEWELTSPDDGAGHWGYTATEGACTVSFWQGLTDGLALVGDDSTDSDALLGYVLDAPTADVTAAAADAELSYLTPGAGGLDARVIRGEEDDGRVWTITARSFTAVGIGVYVIVDCTGGDFDAAADDVVEKNAVIAY